MMETIDRTIDRVRTISAGLRPSVLDRLGLLEAIEWQAQNVERRTGVPWRVESQVEQLDLEADRATQPSRIVQEALTNTIRHACATRVTISLRKHRGRVLPEVRDDGRGVSNEALADPNSLGLAVKLRLKPPRLVRRRAPLHCRQCWLAPLRGA